MRALQQSSRAESREQSSRAAVRVGSDLNRWVMFSVFEIAHHGVVFLGFTSGCTSEAPCLLSQQLYASTFKFSCKQPVLGFWLKVVCAYWVIVGRGNYL